MDIKSVQDPLLCIQQLCIHFLFLFSMRSHLGRRAKLQNAAFDSNLGYSSTSSNKIPMGEQLRQLQTPMRCLALLTISRSISLRKRISNIPSRFNRVRVPGGGAPVAHDRPPCTLRRLRTPLVRMVTSGAKRFHLIMWVSLLASVHRWPMITVKPFPASSPPIERAI